MSTMILSLHNSKKHNEPVHPNKNRRLQRGKKALKNYLKYHSTHTWKFISSKKEKKNYQFASHGQDFRVFRVFANYLRDDDDPGLVVNFGHVPTADGAEVKFANNLFFFFTGASSSAARCRECFRVRIHGL